MAQMRCYWDWNEWIVTIDQGKLIISELILTEIYIHHVFESINSELTHDGQFDGTFYRFHDTNNIKVAHFLSGGIVDSLFNKNVTTNLPTAVTLVKLSCESGKQPIACCKQKNTHTYNGQLSCWHNARATILAEYSSNGKPHTFSNNVPLEYVLETILCATAQVATFTGADIWNVTVWRHV